MTESQGRTLVCPRCELVCPVQDYPATLCQHCLQLLVLERDKQILRPATKSEFWALFDHFSHQYNLLVQSALTARTGVEKVFAQN